MYGRLPIHRHFVGFFNVPVQAPTWGQSVYLFRETESVLVIMCCDWNTFYTELDYNHFNAKVYTYMIAVSHVCAYEFMTDVTSRAREGAPGTWFYQALGF